MFGKQKIPLSQAVDHCIGTRRGMVSVTLSPILEQFKKWGVPPITNDDAEDIWFAGTFAQTVMRAFDFFDMKTADAIAEKCTDYIEGNSTLSKRSKELYDSILYYYYSKKIPPSRNLKDHIRISVMIMSIVINALSACEEAIPNDKLERLFEKSYDSFESITSYWEKFSENYKIIL